MPRLPSVDANADPETAKVFSELKGSRGWVSNVLRSVAHAPEGLRRLATVGDYSRYHTALDERMREIVILTTGRGSNYAWSHHAPLGLQAGLTQAEIDALKEGRAPPTFDPREAAVVRYLVEFGTAGVSDATFAALAAELSPREITDVTIIAAYYTGLALIIAAFGVEIEDHDQLEVELEWQRRKNLSG
jgi:alkylhydroperoxidase family enzyme